MDGVGGRLRAICHSRNLGVGGRLRAIMYLGAASSAPTTITAALTSYAYPAFCR